MPGENLTRVEDIVRELSVNLDKLEAQALVAERYRSLQQEGDEKQRLLWLLRQTEAEQEQQRHRRSIEAAQNEVESQTARLREVEADLEGLRAAHYAAHLGALRPLQAVVEDSFGRGTLPNKENKNI